MEINIWVVLYILSIHWFADFILQTDVEAKNKSKSFYFLISHTLTYSICWWFLFPLLGIHQTLIFIGTTLIFHTITDYFTSKLNSKLWEQGKTHDFFVSVGFDQLLHFIQLLITYQLLK